MPFFCFWCHSSIVMLKKNEIRIPRQRTMWAEGLQLYLCCGVCTRLRQRGFDGDCLSAFSGGVSLWCVLAVIDSGAIYFVFGINRGVRAPALLEAYSNPIFFCPRCVRDLPVFFLSFSLCTAPSPVQAAV